MLDFSPFFLEKVDLVDSKFGDNLGKIAKKCKRRFKVAARRSRVATWRAGFLSDFPLKINVDFSDREKNVYFAREHAEI